MANIQFHRVVALLSASALLASCAVGPRSWVDPASIGDREKYEVDLRECNTLAELVKKEDQEARRAAMPANILIGVLVGAALGAMIAPSGSRGSITRYGAAVGGVSGAGAGASEASASPQAAATVAMRECLRGRGYRPIR